MIIESLLDSDLYKFTMQQCVLHQFPDVDVQYNFKCRNGNIFTQEQVDRINKEIDDLCSLTFKDDELDYLSSIRFIKRDYIDFLRNFKLNRRHINTEFNNGHLEIIVKGNWFLTILFEVPVLAIVNEVYFSDKVVGFNDGMHLLEDKIKLANTTPGFVFSDFGTRRRFSYSWMRKVIERLATEEPKCSGFAGTSNVLFAKDFGVTAIGTMAHEFIMGGQGIDVTLRNSQKHMLQAWVDEYRGDLGIALTDTLGVDAFLRDFDLYFSKLYDGVRHDSGDPIEWGEKIIDHYMKLRIDPTTKTLVFSDGLTFPKAVEILEHFRGRAKISFGIGTNLTNDFSGITPLNIVMKLTQVNGKPVAKISDTPSKGMCNDDQYLAYLRTVFGIRNA